MDPFVTNVAQPIEVPQPSSIPRSQSAGQDDRRFSSYLDETNSPRQSADRADETDAQPRAESDRRASDAPQENDNVQEPDREEPDSQESERSASEKPDGELDNSGEADIAEDEDPTAEAVQTNVAALEQTATAAPLAGIQQESVETAEISSATPLAVAATSGEGGEDALQNNGLEKPGQAGQTGQAPADQDGPGITPSSQNGAPVATSAAPEVAAEPEAKTQINTGASKSADTAPETVGNKVQNIAEKAPAPAPIKTLGGQETPVLQQETTATSADPLAQNSETGKTAPDTTLASNTSPQAEAATTGQVGGQVAGTQDPALLAQAQQANSGTTGVWRSDASVDAPLDGETTVDLNGSKPAGEKGAGEQSTSRAGQQTSANAQSTTNQPAMKADVDILSGQSTFTSQSDGGEMQGGGTIERVSAQTTQLRAVAPQQAGAPQPSVPVNSMAAHIARQAFNGTNKFQIRLDPPELGRVDVRLEVNSDGTVKTHLIVERAETLDLLQRDARSLERALNNSGLDSKDGALSFSLKDQGEEQEKFAGSQAGGDEPGEADQLLENEDEVANALASQDYIATSGLDIRV